MNTPNLFVPIKFKTTVTLTPSEIKFNNQFKENTFHDIIIHQLKKKYEEKCSKYGYIRKDSLTMVSRSVGEFIKQHFNSSIMYHATCKAEVCNPAIGSKFECTVVNRNQFGLTCEGIYDDIVVMRIMIPNTTSRILNEVDIVNIKIGEEILVEVLGNKYLLQDKTIQIIARTLEKQQKKAIIQNVIDDDDEKHIDDSHYENQEEIFTDDEENSEVEDDEDDEDDEDEDEDELGDDDDIDDDETEIFDIEENGEYI